MYFYYSTQNSDFGGKTLRSFRFSPFFVKNYIKHFFDGIAALPEWAPADENHLLKSSSVVQNISYEPTQISYKTFLPAAKEILRLTKMPKQILVDGKPLKRVDDTKESEGWSWEKLSDGGVVRLNRLGGRDVLILLK